MKAILSTLAVALAAATGALSHGVERSMHPREIASRQLAANRRHIVARKCASQIAEYQRKRKMARRSLMEKRATGFTATTSALEPHETTIRNTTCVTAPEVTEGPYYLNNDLIRQDIREDQGGILLELDIGVIDTSTCQPLPDALVEIWHCNATGQYSGFSTTSAGSTGGGSVDGGSMTMSIDPSTMSGGGDTAGGAMPSGGTGGGDGAGGVQSSAMTDSYNFLRGGWPTNQNGIVTFNTVYPGFYTGRTIHIHTMVHTNITYNTNGTYTSRSGSLVHIGQMFFDDSLSDQIVALAPYSQTTMTRQRNDADSILAQENSAGYSAYVDASAIDSSDLSAGILGFITVGVDSTAIHEVTSYNYYTGGDLYEAVGPDSTGSTTVKSATTTKTASTTGTSTADSSSGAVSRFGALAWLRAARSLLA